MPNKVSPQEAPRTKEHGYSVSELIKKPTNLLFLALAIFTFGGFIPFTKGGYDFMVITTQSDKMPKGYKFPNIRDMDLMLYSAVFFAAIELKPGCGIGTGLVLTGWVQETSRLNFLVSRCFPAVSLRKLWAHH